MMSDVVYETLGVASALAYVVLAGRNHWACWPASIMSVVVYAGINYQAGLFAESALQVFYGILSVVGWMRWRPGSGESKTLVSWPSRALLFSWLWLVPLSMILALILSRFTTAQLPLLDAPITVFSLYATWLTTKRVLQHWIYWIAIDALSVWVYLNRGLPLTAVLFALYCLLACWGWWQWRRMMHQRS
jgi:nicotinamide mononucleotide transporter